MTTKWNITLHLSSSSPQSLMVPMMTVIRLGQYVSPLKTTCSLHSPRVTCSLMSLYQHLNTERSLEGVENRFYQGTGEMRSGYKATDSTEWSILCCVWVIPVGLNFPRSKVLQVCSVGRSFTSQCRNTKSQVKVQKYQY